jgi:hypothetical protein
MRSGIIGFILGALLVVVALLVLQKRIIHDVAPDLSFRFDRYVFDGPDFPKGDFGDGRLVHRFLFPSRYTVTFYDAQYNEVAHADKPGRYGAVVRMTFGLGDEVTRFVTLYRTQKKVFWAEESWPMTVQLPPEIGLDPTVLQVQQGQIGQALKSEQVHNGEGSPELAILLAGLSETYPTDPPASVRTNATARDADWWYGLRQRIGQPLKYRYSLILPKDYDADATKRWPLILYLHSVAENGSNINKVLASGLPLAITQGRQLPAIVLSPQCPDYETWSASALFQLIDDISAQYRVDPDRIYVTGGSEAWVLLAIHPDKFAAVVPIEGRPDSADAARLKDIPLWAFNSANEPGVPVGMTTAMVNAIRAAGGHAHVTTTDGRFDPWDVAYGEISNDYSTVSLPHDQATFMCNADPVYAWLLAQKRGQPEVAMPGVPSP